MGCLWNGKTRFASSCLYDNSPDSVECQFLSSFRSFNHLMALRFYWWKCRAFDFCKRLNALLCGSSEETMISFSESCAHSANICAHDQFPTHFHFRRCGVNSTEFSQVRKIPKQNSVVIETDRTDYHQFCSLKNFAGSD